MLAFRTKINASKFLALLIMAVLALPACKPEEQKKAEDDCKEENSVVSSSNNGKGNDNDKDNKSKSASSSKCKKDNSKPAENDGRTPASFAFPSNPARDCVVDKFQQSENDKIIKKVDILFVMDTSGSMANDWARVANNVQNLVKELPKDQDYRFAVLLAQAGFWKGKLYSPNSSIPKVLDSKKHRIQDISRDLHKMFTEAMKIRDEIGSGEVSFLSLYHAVTNHAKGNQRLGFFRADAALSVIFMSDEHEMGFPFPNPQAPGLPPRCDAAFEDRAKRELYDSKGINLQSTLNAVKKLKADMPVLTHAFVNITKEDLFKRNSKNASCLYDSLGYGYFDIVKATPGGVLFSIQENRAEGMARCGRAIRESLELVKNFPLSRPADQVDVATVLAAVDGKKVAHEYTAANSSVFLNDAGTYGSKIEIQHCKPITRQEWTIQDFTGTAGQFAASLSWKTPEYATNGKIRYGNSAEGLTDEVAGNGENTNHVISVTGLDPNTVYYFQAVSVDNYGQEKVSEVISLRTKPDWAIAGVAAETSRFSAAVKWKTSDYATRGKVKYGVRGNALTAESAETANANDHEVVLTGLNANTAYDYQILSRDEFGLEKSSAVGSFQTLTDWNIVAAGVTASRNSAVVGWKTPDLATVGRVDWGLSPDALNNNAPSAVGVANEHSVTIEGLQAGTIYYFQVVGRDSLNVEKRSNVLMAQTVRDWNINGFVGNATENSVSIDWNTDGFDTDGKVVWGSTAEALSNQVGSAGIAAAHSVTVTGLNADTVYYFQAISSDSLGLTKASAVTAIRTKATVVVPPPKPEWEITDFNGVAATTSVSIAWKTDAYETVGKLVFGTNENNLNQEMSNPAAIKSHNYYVIGLNPSTLYYFQAISVDDFGQEKRSAVMAVSTLAQDPTDPPPVENWVIFGFDATTTATSSNVIWQTPGAATKATVRIGFTAEDLSHRVIDVPDYAETHVITVSGLTPNTTYFMKVIAVDRNGRTQESVVIRKQTKSQ